MEPEFSRQIFDKSSNIKFHLKKNPFSARKVVQGGRTDRPTDMLDVKITFFFRNFADAPKNIANRICCAVIKLTDEQLLVGFGNFM